MANRDDGELALMPWARLEDNYFTNGKIVGDATYPGLSKDAKLLDLAGIAFSARELRDGRLSGLDVRIVGAQVDVDDLGRCLKELVRAARWLPIAGGQGWEIHDYLVYNPTREKVLKDREEARLRMQDLREGRKPQSRSSRNGSPERSGEQTANVRENLIDPGPGPGNVPGPGAKDSPSGSAPRASARPRARRVPHEPVDETFTEAMVAEYAPQLGGVDHVRLVIDKAMNHPRSVGCLNQRQYLKNWLRGDVETYQSRNGHANGKANGVAPKPDSYYLGEDSPAPTDPTEAF